MTVETFIDYYEILGVSSQASAAEIKHAYRELAKKYHPDTANADTTRLMAQINVAYETLIDPEKRAAHDAEIRAHAGARYSSSGSSGAAGDTAAPGAGPGRRRQQQPVIFETAGWFRREHGWEVGRFRATASRWYFEPEDGPRTHRFWTFVSRVAYLTLDSTHDGEYLVVHLHLADPDYHIYSLRFSEDLRMDLLEFFDGVGVKCYERQATPRRAPEEESQYYERQYRQHTWQGHRSGSAWGAQGGAGGSAGTSQSSGPSTMQAAPAPAAAQDDTGFWLWLSATLTPPIAGWFLQSVVGLDWALPIAAVISLVNILFALITWGYSRGVLVPYGKAYRTAVGWLGVVCVVVPIGILVAVVLGAIAAEGERSGRG